VSTLATIVAEIGDYSRQCGQGFTDHAALLIVVLQPELSTSFYQQLFEIYLHHPLSAAISKVNYFAGRVALIHHF